MSALISLFAFAAVAAPNEGLANTATPKSAEKKICKVDPEDTESRIRRRICKTASEWAGGNKESEDNGRQSTSR